MFTHAERELELAGYLNRDSEYGGMLAESVMELLEVFENQGHSGHSASHVVSLFNKLASREVLTPLTGEESEWKSNGQNRRCSSVFRDDDGRAYNVYAIAWISSDGGHERTFTGMNNKGVTSKQYIKKFPFTPVTFYREEDEDIADLKEVWEIYDEPEDRDSGGNAVSS